MKYIIFGDIYLDMTQIISQELFLEAVGQNVKKGRFRKGWSQEKLGLEIGLTRMQVSRIEKGYNITLTTILKLALALDIKPGSLLKVELVKGKGVLEGLVENSKANRSKKDS